MKWTVEEGVSNRVDIVKDIQFKPLNLISLSVDQSSQWWKNAKMDKDGYLFAGTADTWVSDHKSNLIAGKVLRIDGDGKAPGNKFKGDKRTTYGHRNVQGIDSVQVMEELTASTDLAQ